MSVPIAQVAPYSKYPTSFFLKDSSSHRELGARMVGARIRLVLWVLSDLAVRQQGNMTSANLQYACLMHVSEFSIIQRLKNPYQDNSIDH
jgi:hypothetical protein